MNKPELVAAISNHSGVDAKSVSAVLNGFEAVVVNAVKKGDKIALSGFVSFERVERKARTARNPQTGEPIKVKASKAPRVSAGASFKKIVKGESPAPKLVTK